jgi:putative Ca2+/H+ antiporter (TMEM165/GDT1 family)
MSGFMEAFFVSTGIVAIAEIGDKTQLLALLLAARFRKPWPIVWGILIATLANHGLAAWAGTLAAQYLGEGGLGSDTFKLIIGASFLLMAGWALVPDKVDDDETPKAGNRGAFMTTLVAFFLVEMGDKTQVATIGLAANYGALLLVAAGTTVGMMLANGPAVLVGHGAATRLPLGLIRSLAALSFAALGVAALADGLGWL